LQWRAKRQIEVRPAPNPPHNFGNRFPDLWKRMDGRQARITPKQFNKAYNILLFRDRIKEVEDPRIRIEKVYKTI
jgi:hypothetical protein